MGSRLGDAPVIRDVCAEALDGVAGMDDTARTVSFGLAPRRSRRSAALGLSVGVVSLGVFLAAARLDPDPHHDGVVLAPAIGAAEGLHLHSELFSQYGPMATWLQIPAIWLGGPHLLSIRVHAAIALCLSAVLIALFVRTTTCSDAVGGLAAGVWVAECQDWAVADRALFPLWPWPSVYFALFVLLYSRPAGLGGEIASGCRAWESCRCVGGGSMLHAPATWGHACRYDRGSSPHGRGSSCTRRLGWLGWKSLH